MLVVVGDGIGPGRDRMYVFDLTLFHEANNVSGNLLTEGEDGAVTYRGVGSKES